MSYRHNYQRSCKQLRQDIKALDYVLTEMRDPDMRAQLCRDPEEHEIDKAITVLETVSKVLRSQLKRRTNATV